MQEKQGNYICKECGKRHGGVHSDRVCFQCYEKGFR
ncbi:hypothetical protein DSM25558_3194 [Agrobacterium sp. DSM 25558]|nr:hypothetical protein DSM25558_3194 [Agrobacterium sp. DSM 25558]